MQYKSPKGHTGATQIGMLLLFTGAGLILSVIFQLIIIAVLLPPNTSLSNLEGAMKLILDNPANVNAMRIMQGVSTLLMLCIPALAYSWFSNGKQLQWLGFNKHFSIFQIMVGFLLIFSANILAGPIQELSEYLTKFAPNLYLKAKALEDLYNENVQALSNLHGAGDLVSAIFMMAFLPALFEEMFFRGALQNILTRWWNKPYTAIIVSSLIFSLIHFSIWLFLSRFILGMVLGIMFYTTKNIWINTIAHFLNNLIAVIQMYVMSASKEKIDVSKLDPHIDWWMALLAAAVIIYLIILLRRYSEKHVHVIDTEEMDIFQKEQSKHYPFSSIS